MKELSKDVIREVSGGVMRDPNQEKMFKTSLAIDKLLLNGDVWGCVVDIATAISEYESEMLYDLLNPGRIRLM